MVSNIIIVNDFAFINGGAGSVAIGLLVNCLAEVNGYSFLLVLLLLMLA